MVNSNVTTIALNGSEVTVEFAGDYPYYFIRNDSDTPIYVSISPGIIPKTEGVYTILPGGEERIGAGYSLTKFYILGTGEAYIRGERIAVQPSSFKQGGKGGGNSNGIIYEECEYSDLLITNVLIGTLYEEENL